MKFFVLILFLVLSTQGFADSGVCNHKKDEANAAEAAYCKAFNGNESACRTNNSKCVWKNKLEKFCEPNQEGANLADAAYCGAFNDNETACRTNKNKCKWVDNTR